MDKGNLRMLEFALSIKKGTTRTALWALLIPLSIVQKGMP
jgi:hypothetical protein